MNAPAKPVKKLLPKVPLMKEKVATYERLLHDLHFHRSVTMNNAAVVELLNRISTWSQAHYRGNGELDERQLQAGIDEAFWTLDKR
jgi:hypothetical protein